MLKKKEKDKELNTFQTLSVKLLSIKYQFTQLLVNKFQSKELLLNMLTNKDKSTKLKWYHKLITKLSSIKFQYKQWPQNSFHNKETLLNYTNKKDKSPELPINQSPAKLLINHNKLLVFQ